MFLSRPPEIKGDEVHFNDLVFDLPDIETARRVAAKLADCNLRDSLWDLVDLAADLQVKTGRKRPGRFRRPAWETLH